MERPQLCPEHLHLHRADTLLVTGTPSSATCGASTANQHIHGFGGSWEDSPEWYPAGFRFDPTVEPARARQHYLGDDGLAPYISRLVCRARRSSEYLQSRLVDIRQSTRNRIQ